MQTKRLRVQYDREITTLAAMLRFGESYAMLYIYSAKTLRAMLADAKQAIKLVDDNEACAVQEMIDAIVHELSTRKD